MVPFCNVSFYPLFASTQEYAVIKCSRMFRYPITQSSNFCKFMCLFGILINALHKDCLEAIT